MPNIYLIHPKHGAKVAISQDEARSDVANGWKIYTPGVQARLQAAEARAEAEQAVLEAPVVNTLQPRRGRLRKAVEPQEE